MLLKALAQLGIVSVHLDVEKTPPVNSRGKVVKTAVGAFLHFKECLLCRLRDIQID